MPIRESTEIDAPPADVWAVVSDVRRMPEFSPELRKVVVLGRKAGVGMNLLGINRRGRVVWPTTSKVVRWEPERAIASKTRESGATWLYELSPSDNGLQTTLTGSRILARFTTGTALLGPVIGGAVGHDAELADGLRTTLQGIKAVLES
jgi:Polyketide cyclase / dehydrase and lipid transport